jgi:photosystem II stability/assembly factor-like uncharacterized protein
MRSASRTLITTLLFLAPLTTAVAQVDPTLLSGMKYRMVGPFRGGRSTAVTGLPGQPHVFLMGSAMGGVWRTDDAGHHWTNLTDGQLTVGTIGAIDVAQSDPSIIYAGTGSACIRGNVTTGKGVWKSMDGGRTWRFAGLPDAGQIGDLIVHPTNPDLVYLAALGRPFGKNRERGVFRTKDGGVTWEHVLFLNDSTGAVSLAMNPRNPREIYAGAWRAERKPWTLISGGPEGGVYKTTDGGDTWIKLGGGLPTGVVGKVAVAVSPANPDRVWALIEAEPAGGLYRSDDGGVTWERVSTDSRLVARAWYYIHLSADPQDPNTVYVLSYDLYRSVDGGRTFDAIELPHGDTHDMWINPDDPQIFAVADDGGVVVTLNGGRTFSTYYNQPTAEFYDVIVDNQHPYRIYGSQQDNTSISVQHTVSGHSFSPLHEWRFASGCESGPVALHPDHPEILWGGCYRGVINVMDVKRDTRRNVQPYPEDQGRAPKDLRNRWQWVAPIVVSPHDPNTVYYASQYLYRTRDAGMTWERISPDLTTNDPVRTEYPGGPIHGEHVGVEVFSTIFAVAVSPHDPGTIWVGSDDGRVHITRDEGGTWTDITPRGMPVRGTVNRIEVSRHEPGRAILAVHRYREDDWAPYVFRTNDFGRSWTLLTDGRNGIPATTPVRVVREDPDRRGLLYAGTEFGMYVSFDDGARWQSLQLNLAEVPITDLQVHRRDLVVATQGRSFWVLDDLTPLQELAASPAVARARLFAPRDAARGVMGEVLGGPNPERPDTLPFGALVHYTLATPASRVTLEVLDGEGTLVRRWSSDSAEAAEARTPRLSGSRGFHRVVWDLTYPGPRPVGTGPAPFGGAGAGVKAPPGAYEVRLGVDGERHARPVRVVGNPNDPSVTAADYLAQFQLARAVRDSLNAIRVAIGTIRDVREQAQAVVDRARAAGREVGRLPQLWESLTAALTAVEEELTQTRGGRGLAVPSKLDADYLTLHNFLTSVGGYSPGSAEGRPPRGAYERQADLDRQWTAIRERYEQTIQREVSAFNAEVGRLGLVGVVRM